VMILVVGLPHVMNLVAGVPHVLEGVPDASRGEPARADSSRGGATATRIIRLARIRVESGIPGSAQRIRADRPKT
jgi:hypothetical protein